MILFTDAYGFRVVDSSTMLVSAYVEFEAAYAREPIKKVRSKKSRSISPTRSKRPTRAWFKVARP